MTQLQKARLGIVTPEMFRVAEKEQIDPDLIRERIARGIIVIPRNKLRSGTEPTGIGKGLRTKVNASIGTSPEYPDLAGEIKKLEVAIKAGADTIMDLSTGGEIDKMRRTVLARTVLPVGSVPVYQAAIESIEQRGSVVKMTAEDMFKMIEKHAADGIDFIAIHCAINFDVIKRLKNQGRVTDIVSRGGGLSGWLDAA